MKKFLLVASAVASVLMVGCGDGYSSNDDSGYSSSSSVMSQSSSSSSSATASVVLGSASRSVNYMVDAEGMSLYEFDKDTLNTSNCIDGCLDIWPIFSATTTQNSDFGAINNSHTTYLSHPMYYFANDTKAGDVNGDKVKNIWHLVYPPAGFQETADAKRSSVTRTQTFLTDENGMALYTFDKDDVNVSNCVDGCLDIWPIHSGAINLAKLPQGLDAAKFGSITRTDTAQVQTTYNGLPLYTFANDTKAGDSNGDWVKGVWHLVELGSVANELSVDENTQKVQKGADRFAQGCTSCHGLDGRTSALGVSQIIADINDANEVKTLLTALKNGAPGKHPAMISVASGLSDEEIDNLSAYIATLN